MKLSATAAHLVIEAGDAPFDFEPGQYVALSLDAGGESIKWYYSIASAPNGSNHFELCVHEPAGKPGILIHLDGMKQHGSLEVFKIEKDKGRGNGEDDEGYGQGQEYQTKHMILDVGFWMWDFGCGILDVGC